MSSETDELCERILDARSTWDPKPDLTVLAKDVRSALAGRDQVIAGLKAAHSDSVTAVQQHYAEKEAQLRAALVQSDAAITELRKSADRIANRRDRLLEALRERVIHVCGVDNDERPTMKACALCRGEWHVREKERHLTGCPLLPEGPGP